MTAAAHWSKYPQIISFHYFRATGVKWGVKWSENHIGTHFFLFQILFFSQNWIIFKNVQNMSKNATFGKVLWSLFNYDWKTAAETRKNEFLEDFRFIWYPTCPQERESNGMKWFGGHLIQCVWVKNSNPSLHNQIKTLAHLKALHTNFSWKMLYILYIHIFGFYFIYSQTWR